MSISMKGPFMLRRVSGEITVVIWCLGCQEHHRGSVPLMKSFLTDRMEPIQPEPDKQFGAGVSARTYQTWSALCHFMESYSSASIFFFFFANLKLSCFWFCTLPHLCPVDQPLFQMFGLPPHSKHILQSSLRLTQQGGRLCCVWLGRLGTRSSVSILGLKPFQPKHGVTCDF